MLRMEQIARVMPSGLTPIQRKVLDHILKHSEQVVFLTATDLARQLNVSDTSIVRLAQALGYEGYPGLKRRMRELVQPRLSTVERLGETVRKVESVDDVLSNVLLCDMNNLRKTAEDIDPEVFSLVVDVLEEAKRVFVIALRSTHCLAVFMASALRFLGREVILLTPGTGEMWEQLRDIGSGDVIVGFSFPRYTKITVQVMAFARERNARVVAITDGDLSPLASSAHYMMTVPYEIDSFVESFTAALSLVNALVTGLAFRRQADTIKILQGMEDAWAREGIYWE
ncbi:MAG: MurR/RpiR family transcriptional regulator [bacterium]|nr:MAG: MurR/RpiR family transcriptional regulator [bacterium]